MKTDTEIKTDIYMYIKDSLLAKSVTGVLRKTRRPLNSKKEDIIISVLSNVNGQIQEAYVNVNIYVSDIERDGQYEENSPRLDKLCKQAEQLLSLHYGVDYRINLESQRIYEVNDANEHVINNKLLYKKVNE